MLTGSGRYAVYYLDFHLFYSMPWYALITCSSHVLNFSWATYHLSLFLCDSYHLSLWLHVDLGGNIDIIGEVYTCGAMCKRYLDHNPNIHVSIKIYSLDTQYFVCAILYIIFPTKMIELLQSLQKKFFSGSSFGPSVSSWTRQVTKQSLASILAGWCKDLGNRLLCSLTRLLTCDPAYVKIPTMIASFF